MTAGFDHLAPGTAEQDWARSRLSRIPPACLPQNIDRTLVLAAHPDDETLGAGGLIQTVSRLGGAIEVIVASDGEASHPRSPTHSPRELARLRRAEVSAAVAALAPSAQVRFLGLPDGTLADRVDTLTTELRAQLGARSWLIAPWEGDRHPDHSACARAAISVTADAPGHTCWQYPIWAWHWAEPEDTALPWHQFRRLDLDAQSGAAKRRALECYASQYRALSELPGDEAILPAGIVEHFQRPYETFVLPVTRDAGDPSYFDALYAAHDDPWELQTRFYEIRKRDLILAALPRARYSRAFEPGCAIGALSTSLAARCEELIAWDVAPRALEQARLRLSGHRAVQLAQGQIPQQWPEGTFDLIVLSEVGYYCRDLDELSARIEASLSPDGTVVACHWRHPAPDHPQSARAVHEALGARLRSVVHHVETDFWLDVWTPSGESVAGTSGVFG